MTPYGVWLIQMEDIVCCVFYFTMNGLLMSRAYQVSQWECFANTMTSHYSQNILKLHNFIWYKLHLVFLINMKALTLVFWWKWMKMDWAMKMACMNMALYENVPGWPLTSSDHEGVFIRLYWLSRQFSNYIKEKTTTFNSIIYDLLTIHKDVEMLLGLQGVFSPAEPKSSINFHLYSALHSVFNNPEKKECTGRKFERLNNFKN